MEDKGKVEDHIAASLLLLGRLSMNRRSGSIVNNKYISLLLFTPAG
jgi:hypothetical protein